MKKRRKNPARIERSQIRLEKFLKKKANDKNQAENSLGNQAVGSSPSRLVIDLNKQEGEKGDRSVVAGQPSPIPQVDGEVKSIPPDQVIYTFVNDYHKDAIEYTLEELFPAKNAQLVSCIAPRPMQSADQECIVVIKKVTSEDVSWPEMDSEQSCVFQDIGFK